MTGLCIFGIIFIFCSEENYLRENWNTEYPRVNVAGEERDGTVWTAIFYGFSSAMLGVSGFETSSQFIEEQVRDIRLRY